MQRDYNGDNYDIFKAKIYFSLIRVLKIKKTRLVLTLFYCLSQGTPLDDSSNIIHINQSGLCNSLRWKNLKMFNIT